MLRVREPRCSIYNSFLYPSVSSFVLSCSLAIEFVRFLHRRRSPPCCVLESRVVLFTTLFFTLRFLLSSCGVHLQSSLSDFYIVGGAHHAACQRAALFYLQLFSLPFGFFFRLVAFTCNRVCQIFISSEEPTMLRVREPRCSIHELQCWMSHCHPIIQRIGLNSFASFRSMLGSSGVRTRCFFE